MKIQLVGDVGVAGLRIFHLGGTKLEIPRKLEKQKDHCLICSLAFPSAPTIKNSGNEIFVHRMTAEKVLSLAKFWLVRFRRLIGISTGERVRVLESLY